MSATRAEVEAGLAGLEAELGAEAVLEVIGLFSADAAALADTMRAAAATGDADGLRRAAHTLKSTAASFGALTLSGACRIVEDRARAGATADAAPDVDCATDECARVLAILADEQVRRGG